MHVRLAFVFYFVGACACKFSLRSDETACIPCVESVLMGAVTRNSSRLITSTQGSIQINAHQPVYMVILIWGDIAHLLVRTAACCNGTGKQPNEAVQLKDKVNGKTYHLATSKNRGMHQALAVRIQKDSIISMFDIRPHDLKHLVALRTFARAPGSRYLIGVYFENSN